MSDLHNAAIALGFISLAASPAAAAMDQAPATAPSASKPVRERLICEEEEEIGTRLGGHEVCMTKAQWEERRHGDRQLIEGSQSRGQIGEPPHR